MFNFNTPLYIVGSGSFDPEQFLNTIETDAPIIAADGGADHLYALDIVPHAIIGDMDSLAHKAWPEETQIVEISDQDSTDIEKVLDRAQAPYIYVYGCAGSRFDHTLEILHILQKYNDKRLLFFAGNDIIFRMPKTWSVVLPPQSRISLYPLQKTTIQKAKGFKYDPTGLTFEQGMTIGTSNETTQENISLTSSAPLAGIVSAEHYSLISRSL